MSNLYADEELLRRAVVACCKAKGPRPRWAYVRDMFSIGATSSRHLCRRFGIDPWSEVSTTHALREEG